jgi:N-acyl-L-homoserine lactone synthetase
MKKISIPAVQFTIASSRKEIQMAKRLCHDTYLAEKYISKPYPNGIIPFKHDKNAIYVIAKNSAGNIIGTLRLFKGPAFKTLQIWKNEINPEAKEVLRHEQNKIIEVGALAVNHLWNNYKISWGLYRKGLQWIIMHHFSTILMSVDSRVLRALCIIGWKIEVIGRPKFYMGSLTIPGIIRIKEQVEKFSLNENSFKQYLAA